MCEGVYFLPTPKEGKGKREGGCTLTVQGFMNAGGDPQAYISITDSIEAALDKIKEARIKGTFVEFERNDHSCWSGEILHINPNKIVNVG